MKDELLSRIHEEEARLASLERETSEARARLEALRRDLATTTAAVDGRARLGGAAATSAPSSPAEKVWLFRRLFHGRGDVFPRLWVNERNGTKGYAPACFTLLEDETYWFLAADFDGDSWADDVAAFAQTCRSRR
ncbi:MAG: hypothetical protein HYY35_09055 [Deltaproteobacteria bacterium]|nr:hypothetical protein [Deltaproteobacteria bacterium]